MPNLPPDDPVRQTLMRRHLLRRGATGIGLAALATLLSRDRASAGLKHPAVPGAATNVIYIFTAGGPPQMELYDYKPGLKRRHGEELPKSVFANHRLTGFTSGQKSYPIAAPTSQFVQRGNCGLWLSELLPHLGGMADELCLVRSLFTDAVNHDPAVTFLLTGTQQPGRPSLGAWLSYGLGSENQNLPAFVVLLTMGQFPEAATPLSARHWGSGFLPSQHQGVKFRSGPEPVLYLSNPKGLDAAARRQLLNVAGRLNAMQFDEYADPEIMARVAQYELAFRMQSAVPELTDLSRESEQTLKLYGPQATTPGSYAANCLLARRLVEAGVRFVQVFDRDWDHHRNQPGMIRAKARQFDQPTAGLLADLKQRGLLDTTLVVCAGEFGRTIYCQGPLEEKFGRDHHAGCYSAWLAGAGVRAGMQYGATDDFSFNVVENPVHVHDLNATLLWCLGIDHEQLTYQFQGRHHRLTDVHGRVVEALVQRRPAS